VFQGHFSQQKTDQCSSFFMPDEGVVSQSFLLFIKAGCCAGVFPMSVASIGQKSIMSIGLNHHD